MAAKDRSRTGDVEDCALAPSGVSGCHTILTLPGGQADNGTVLVIPTADPKVQRNWFKELE